MHTWVYTSEATAKRIREKYLKAILRQDIQFFDQVGPGEVAARIQMDTRESCQALTGYIIKLKSFATRPCSPRHL